MKTQDKKSAQNIFTNMDWDGKNEMTHKELTRTVYHLSVLVLGMRETLKIAMIEIDSIKSKNLSNLH